MKVPFSKLSGCGNDFILIDNSDQKFSAASPTWLTQVCHRHHGIGADGVIWLEKTSGSIAAIRLYNADGSEAESCGNAFRCVLTYLKNRNPSLSTCKIETPFTVVTARCESDLIRIEIPNPSNMQWNIPLNIGSDTIACHFLHTGVPHLVVFVDDLENTDVAHLGKTLRHHPQFAPHGTNVNFVAKPPQPLAYRTYERGVGETLACGSGAVAVALATAHLYGLTTPITVITRSGETLQVDFSIPSPNQFHHVSLSGPAQLVYEGNIELGQVPHG